MSKKKKKKTNSKVTNIQNIDEVNAIAEKDKILEEIKTEIEESKIKEKEEKEEKKEEKQDKSKKQDKNEKLENKTSNEEISKEETTAVVPVQKEKKENADKKKTHSKKKIIIILSIVLILAIIVSVLSTIFALLLSRKDTIAKGVSVKNIDLSELTKEEAKVKLVEELVKELNININLKYGDIIEPCTSEDIVFRYDVPKALEQAYSYGRDDNIVIDNFNIVKALINGNNIDIDYKYDKEKANSKIKSLQSKIPGVVVEPSYEIDEATLIVSKGKDGLAIDEEELEKRIIDNILSRNHNEIKADQEAYVFEVSATQKQADKINMAKISEDIYTEPVNAIFVKEPFSLTKEINGVKLAISTEEAQSKVDGEDKAEYSFPLTITKPEITINDIGLEAFPYKVSTFSTNYNAGDVGRTNNLKIASTKTNNLVLMPGEIFSFNKVVGKRTVEEGYKDAKIYENGKVVDGLAGGICQVSSTLYDAALLANLEIVERYNHQFTTSYLPGGKDATVVYGIKDLKFKNNREYPIKIVTSIGGGTLTYSIYGIQQANEYNIVITPVITSRIANKTITEVDKSLAPGKSVTVQAGHSGQRVTTYKEVWQNGTKLSSTVISNDVYNPMNTIIHVGPTPAPAPAPTATPAPNTTPTPQPTTP